MQRLHESQAQICLLFRDRSVGDLAADDVRVGGVSGVNKSEHLLQNSIDRFATAAAAESLCGGSWGGGGHGKGLTIGRFGIQEGSDSRAFLRGCMGDAVVLAREPWAKSHASRG